MTRLPLTVIGGYLGAGKTTLINGLLTGDHGLRLMVLVNDFGAINIDASLLKVQGDDMIELTNGCVCCSLAGSLFQAVGDILDRPQRPDHLIIEASGISDPAKIANLALAEPDLDYAGILTLVDGLNFAGLIADPQIGDQIAAQVRVADFLAVSKVPDLPGDLATMLRDLSPRDPYLSDATEVTQALLFADARPSAQPVAQPLPHPDYVQWSRPDPAPMDRSRLTTLLAQRPAAILRLKGFVPDPGGGLWEVQVVGNHHDLRPCADPVAPGVVAIGLRSDRFLADLDAWWPA